MLHKGQVGPGESQHHKKQIKKILSHDSTLATEDPTPSPATGNRQPATSKSTLPLFPLPDTLQLLTTTLQVIKPNHQWRPHFL